MKSMVDKVADALFEYQLKTYPESKTAKREFYEAGIYHESARVAIAAMREPTNDQANEYYKIRKSCADSDMMACFNASVWESMIDAALAEPQS